MTAAVRRVLVVSDDLERQRSIAAAIRVRGFQVESAGRILQAFDLLSWFSWDAVVVAMDDADDGLQVIELTHRQRGRVSVLWLPAGARPDAVSVARALGSGAVVPMPVTPAQVAEAVVQLLTQ